MKPMWTLKIIKVNSNGIISYGVVRQPGKARKKSYKIVLNADGTYSVYHKDPSISYRNMIKKHPNKSWHYNLISICLSYEAAEAHINYDFKTCYIN